MQNRVKRHRRPRLLAVFAHPDDETFCAGGTLAKYVAAGWEVMVVSATRGQAGQIRDPQAATRRTLGQVREREFSAACEQLGVRSAQVLDYMDGTLQEVDPDELTDAVVQNAYPRADTTARHRSIAAIEGATARIAGITHAIAQSMFARWLADQALNTAM